jgi:hypothetical protein
MEGDLALRGGWWKTKKPKRLVTTFRPHGTLRLTQRPSGPRRVKLCSKVCALASSFWGLSFLALLDFLAVGLFFFSVIAMVSFSLVAVRPCSSKLIAIPSVPQVLCLE